MSALSSFRSNPWPEPMGRTKSRLSAWFHGRSVVGNERSQLSQHAIKTWRNTGRYTASEMEIDLPATSGLRSPSSTRSIIDPSSSPNVGSGPAYPSVFRCVRREETRPLEVTRYEDEILGIAGNPRTRTRLALSRPRSKPRNNKPSRVCFPRVQNPQLKSKAVGCLISGGLLISTLTTCKSGPFRSDIFGQTNRPQTSHSQYLMRPWGTPFMRS